MVKIVGASLIVAAAAGGTMQITWEDCGDSSTHGHITDVSPSEITIGTPASLISSGTIDEALTDGAFSLNVKAALGIDKTFTGSACEAKTFTLPLGLGSASWEGLDCPVAAGAISASVGVSLSAAIPASLAKADVAVSATDQNGDKAICVTAHLTREQEQIVPVDAGTMIITFDDCGDSDTHGHITDVQPPQITIGQPASMVSSGTIDEALTDGAFSINVKAALGIDKTFTGSACEAKTFSLPLGLGSASWDGLDCPVAAGPLSASVGVSLSAAIPAALAKADVAVSATDQNGDKAICVTAHLTRQSTQQVEV